MNTVSELYYGCCTQHTYQIDHRFQFTPCIETCIATVCVVSQHNQHSLQYKCSFFTTKLPCSIEDNESRYQVSGKLIQKEPLDKQKLCLHQVFVTV